MGKRPGFPQEYLHGDVHVGFWPGVTCSSLPDEVNVLPPIAKRGNDSRLYRGPPCWWCLIGDKVYGGNFERYVAE